MHLDGCPIEVIPGSDCCCGDALIDMGYADRVGEPQPCEECKVNAQPDCNCI